jgi:hypothetical protein
MRVRFASLWLVLVALLAGCASPPQPPVGLAGDYFSTRTSRIGVAVSEIPKPDTVFPGADCLLCLAAASIANNAMTGAVQTWSTNDLKSLKAELVAMLAARGQTAVPLDDNLKLADLPDRQGAEPGFARKDFSALAKRAQVDRLLVVDLRALGAWRNYAAYVPTGAPRAVFKAEAYLLDTSNHKLDWYQTFDIARIAEGNWDEPPKFPGLTNAYFQVLEEGKDAIKKPFAK